MTLGGSNSQPINNIPCTPPPHKLYSCLDHFFVSAPLLTHLVAAEIDPITWSDHAPILLDLTLSVLTIKMCHWCLNVMLLRIPNTKDHLLKKLSEFFQINEGTVSKTSTLWEAHKAFFRGECISAGSPLKRESAL